MPGKFDYDKIQSREPTALDAITDIETLRAVAKRMQQDSITVQQRCHELENKLILKEELVHYKERCRELEHKLILKEERIAELLRERWCRSSEKLTAREIDSKQIDLFNEIEKIVESETKTETTEFVPVKSHSRRRGKREALPANLPRIETIIDIDETEKTCGCGTSLVRIGEDTSEKLEMIPTRFVVRRTVRPRYACPCCGGSENEPERPVAVAPVPPAILPKTFATPSLLASIAIWKFQDALPLYRQEHVFSRYGIDLGRATMSRWMLMLAKKCKPIIDLIDAHIRSGPLIGMDETPTQVFGEENRADTATSYMWLARGGPSGKIAVRFMYHPTRSSSVPKEFLRGYCGVLQTDGYEAYDATLRSFLAEGNDGIVHVGCMAHARRMFIKADRSGKKATSAKKALTYFKKLYAIEREATEKNLDDASHVLLRRQQAVPVLEEFKD